MLNKSVRRKREITNTWEARPSMNIGNIIGSIADVSSERPGSQQGLNSTLSGGKSETDQRSSPSGKRGTETLQMMGRAALQENAGQRPCHTTGRSAPARASQPASCSRWRPRRLTVSRPLFPTFHMCLCGRSPPLSQRLGVELLGPGAESQI